VLSTGARLTMAPQTELGRVAIRGRDQFITRLSEDGAPGVEVRDSALQLDAESR